MVTWNKIRIHVEQLTFFKHYEPLHNERKFLEDTIFKNGFDRKMLKCTETMDYGLKNCPIF